MVNYNNSNSKERKDFLAHITGLAQKIEGSAMKIGAVAT